jgi:hypothetical protein
MQIKWIMVGVGGMSAAAFGSATFTTVINQGDPIGGDPNQFAAPVQVVVGADGSIGSISQDTNGDEFVLLSALQGGSWTTNDVIGTDATASVSGLSGPQSYEGFNSLAFTNPGGSDRLDFSATNSVGNAGLLEADGGITGTAVSNVATDGVNGYTFTSNDAPVDNTGPIEFQMNALGSAIFEANNGTTLWRGSAASQTNLFTNGGGYSLPSGGAYRIGLAADGSGAGVLTTGSSGVYSVPSKTLLSGASALNSTQAIMGYSTINSADTALMLFGSGTSQQFALGSGGTPQTLVSFTNTTGEQPTGEMAPNGQIAVYLPSGSNDSADTLKYANAAAVNPASTIQTIASIGEAVTDPSNPGQTIWSLVDPVNAPMINSNGTTVFSAMIGTTLGDAQQAFLSWSPGQTNPTVVIEVNDDMEIGDAPTTSADDATINLIEENDQESESDYYRNSLNDNGEFAVGVAYTYDQNDVSGAAILVTQIGPSLPEPTVTLALLPLAGAALLSRRRRGASTS